MRKVIRLWKKGDYYSVYTILKTQGYDYSIENIAKDFGSIGSMDKFCYLVYLLSNEYSVKNSLLICDFLMYTDTFFYDIHPVIRMIIKRAIELYPTENSLVKWVVTNYEGNPDSPFDNQEMMAYKAKLNMEL